MLRTMSRQQVEGFATLDANRRVFCSVGRSRNGQDHAGPVVGATRAAADRGERVLLTCYNDPLGRSFALDFDGFEGVAAGPFLRLLLNTPESPNSGNRALVRPKPRSPNGGTKRCPSISPPICLLMGRCSTPLSSTRSRTSRPVGSRWPSCCWTRRVPAGCCCWATTPRTSTGGVCSASTG